MGGNNKVSMATLKELFEIEGYANVFTYINSGNIIFETDSVDSQKLSLHIEKFLDIAFKFPIKVIVKSEKEFQLIAHFIPDQWKNDAEMKCDVMFLWNTIDSKDIVKSLVIKESIDTVKYIKGALVWAVDKKNVTKSGLMKIIGTELYSQMTIRNCNTVRKLSLLLNKS